MLRKLPEYLFVTVFFLFSFVTTVFANGADHEEQHVEVAEVITPTLEDIIRSNSIKIVFISSAVVIITVILTIILKNTSEGAKRILFATITIPIILTTLFMVGSTLFLNFKSISGGPVHWHAAYEIWDCGAQIELSNPEGISNKVGSATLHEHNDNWIHLEGVVIEEDQASLGNYFKVVGGRLTDDGFELPTSDGLISRQNGDTCSNGEEGNLQVFVYQTDGKVFTQKKLDNPASYIISPKGNIPPGDCIIVEFDTEEKDKTDRLCGQYKLQVLKGNLYGN